MAKLMTPPLLADDLGIPERTLAQWRYRGIGPAYIKVGRHVRYEEGEIAAWKESQRVSTGPAA